MQFLVGDLSSFGAKVINVLYEDCASSSLVSYTLEKWKFKKSLEVIFAIISGACTKGNRIWLMPKIVGPILV